MRSARKAATNIWSLPLVLHLDQTTFVIAVLRDRRNRCCRILQAQLDRNIEAAAQQQ